MIIGEEGEVHFQQDRRRMTGKEVLSLLLQIAQIIVIPLAVAMLGFLRSMENRQIRMEEYLKAVSASLAVHAERQTERNELLLSTHHSKPGCMDCKR